MPHRVVILPVWLPCYVLVTPLGALVSLRWEGFIIIPPPPLTLKVGPLVEGASSPFLDFGLLILSGPLFCELELFVS